jgi:hypothetical protein
VTVPTSPSPGRTRTITLHVQHAGDAATEELLPEPVQVELQLAGLERLVREVDHDLTRERTAETEPGEGGRSRDCQRRSKELR